MRCLILCAILAMLAASAHGHRKLGTDPTQATNVTGLQDDFANKVHYTMQIGTSSNGQNYFRPEIGNLWMHVEDGCGTNNGLCSCTTAPRADGGVNVYMNGTTINVWNGLTFGCKFSVNFWGYETSPPQYLGGCQCSISVVYNNAYWGVDCPCLSPLTTTFNPFSANSGTVTDTVHYI